MARLSVVSGGSATNTLTPLLQHLAPHSLTFILPISDNGGSTSEILRVLGGPAIGDIRSRVTRMITDEGLKTLLSYRLSEDNAEAKMEWTAIVEGEHHIWNDVEIQCKEMFRSFLVHVHVELLKKSRTASTKFCYELASVGNLLLTGVRLFVGSLDSAIELVSRMTRIDPGIRILPCLNTNYTYHIAAMLTDGSIITGQSQISHPPSTTLPSPVNPGVISTTSINAYEHHQNQHEDVPYQLPDLLISQLKFSKDDTIPLPAPIDRIFYINQYGEEIHPRANSRTIKSLSDSSTIVYSIGSLMTSIVPVLILQGIGAAIVENKGSSKVLLLNGELDRETYGFTALDFLDVIYDAILYSFGDRGVDISFRDVLTHLVYMKDSGIEVDVPEIEKRGIKCVEVNKDFSVGEIHLYDLDTLQSVLSNIINQ